VSDDCEASKKRNVLSEPFADEVGRGDTPPVDTTGYQVAVEWRDKCKVAEAEVARLRVELEGERKANALLVAGMGDVCGGRDELKHENRRLAARVAELEDLSATLAGRVAAQSALLSRKAERPGGS
jgi:hypothetical protein